jgi:hypothetical protein
MTKTDQRNLRLNCSLRFTTPSLNVSGDGQVIDKSLGRYFLDESDDIEGEGVDITQAQAEGIIAAADAPWELLKAVSYPGSDNEEHRFCIDWLHTSELPRDLQEMLVCWPGQEWN